MLVILKVFHGHLVAVHFTTVPMNEENRLSRLQFIGSLVLVLTLALVLGAYFILHDVRLFEGHVQAMEAEFMRGHRAQLARQVESVQSYLEHLRDRSEALLKDKIRAEVDQAYQVATTLYEQEQGRRDPAALQHLIVETLRPLRFFDGRGYFFIDDLQGTCILLPTAPQREGSSLWDNRDDTGHYIMRDLVRAARAPVGEGFSRYRWYAPSDPLRMEDKVAYVRLFEPYNWLIGTGEYLSTFRADLQREALDWIGTIRFGLNGYMMIIADDGTVLVSPGNPDAQGRIYRTLQDPREQALIEQIMTMGREGGGFFEYEWFRPEDMQRQLPQSKLAYVAHMPQWNWTVAAGLYLDDLETTLAQQRAVNQNSLRGRVSTAVLIVLLAAAAAALFSALHARWMKSLITGYRRDLLARTQALQQSTAALDDARSMAGREADERRAAEARLRHVSEHDELTDLPNRTLLRDRLVQALAAAAHAGHRVAVLFLDVDRFKTINDSLGYQDGDRILREVAQRLCQALCPDETVSRYGGDEFVVLLPLLERSHQAAVTAERLAQAVSQPYRLDNDEVLVLTLSIGVSIYPEDGQDADTLLRSAALALADAKDEGRNSYRLFTPEMDARAHERLSLENRLRRALEQGEFELYYQPQFCIADRTLIGYEALVRWRSNGVLVSPGQFIAVAEECGLILPLGAWVLEEACRCNQVWRAAGLPVRPVAVNLSAVQFRRRAVVAAVAQALQLSGLPANCLELELTEGMLMEDIAQSRVDLRELKDMGVRLAVDDFGTGYSSLSYLKRFPLDTLKIDRSFIQDLPGDHDDAAITTAIIRLAKSLGLTTVAEGVETEAQRALLLAEGCDCLQGYLWGRPVPAAELEALLRQGLPQEMAKVAMA